MIIVKHGPSPSPNPTETSALLSNDQLQWVSGSFGNVNNVDGIDRAFVVELPELILIEKEQRWCSPVGGDC